jgi:hypothetical protein
MSGAVRRVFAAQHRISEMGRMWCKVWHPEVTWPVRGQYRCRSCHRIYSVPWEAPALARGSAETAHRRTVEQPPIPYGGAVGHRPSAAAIR